jgi:FkbM family methyltransferase
MLFDSQLLLYSLIKPCLVMRKVIKKTLNAIGILGPLTNFKHNYFPTEGQKEELKAHPARLKFYSQFIKPGNLCFDVGANMGNRTKVFLDLKAKVVAIEPQKDCYDVLKVKYGNRINLITKGLGQKEGIETFFLSSSTEFSSFAKDWVDSVQQGRFSGVHNWNKTETIEMTTLDKLIKEFGRPDFCKIDVEGYELEVLKGLTQPVKLISIEYTVPEQTEKSVACIEYLNTIGKIKCNYSKWETMEFFLPQWISAPEIISIIRSEEFQATRWGDIYITFENI